MFFFLNKCKFKVRYDCIRYYENSRFFRHIILDHYKHRLAYFWHILITLVLLPSFRHANHFLHPYIFCLFYPVYNQHVYLIQKLTIKYINIILSQLENLSKIQREEYIFFSSAYFIHNNLNVTIDKIRI